MLVRQPLRDQVKSLVAQQILDGTLRPGERLSDQELAPRFNVSRTPMREALLDLEREGLVAATVGRGFVVRPLSVAEAAETYPILAGLEALALRTSPVPDRARLAELRALNDQLARAHDPVRRVALDRRWHELLVEGCTNGVLRALIARFTAMLGRYELAYMRRAPRVAASQHHHREIVAALHRRDRTGAARWLERNWQTSARAILDWLEAPAA